MTYKKEAWIEAYKKAVADLKTDKPTSGLPAAVAGLRYVRDGLLADHSKNGKHVAITVETLRESFSELLKAITTAGHVDEGFLSNASAAAKAAGFKSEAEKLSALVD